MICGGLGSIDLFWYPKRYPKNISRRHSNPAEGWAGWEKVVVVWSVMMVYRMADVCM